MNSKGCFTSDTGTCRCIQWPPACGVAAGGSRPRCVRGTRTIGGSTGSELPGCRPSVSVAPGLSLPATCGGGAGGQRVIRRTCGGSWRRTLREPRRRWHDRHAAVLCCAVSGAHTLLTEGQLSAEQAVAAALAASDVQMLSEIRQRTQPLPATGSSWTTTAALSGMPSSKTRIQAPSPPVPRRSCSWRWAQDQASGHARRRQLRPPECAGRLWNCVWIAATTPSCPCSPVVYTISAY